MTTFDGWETQLYGSCLEDGQDSLAHFRTKGSKNGVRRYQQTDGTWTPLGLRERRIREGWGDREQRRAEKKAAKAERKAARVERRNAKTAAKQAAQEERNRRIAEAKEARRKKNIKNLTDDEMRALLNRAKMEQEYRELVKSPLLKTGEQIIGKLIEASAKKKMAEVEANKQRLEMMKITEATKQAKLGVQKAKQEAVKAEEDRKKMEKDVEGGLKIQRKAALQKEKTQYKRFKADNTILGGIKKRANALLSAGKTKELEAAREGRGKAKAQDALTRANERQTTSERYTKWADSETDRKIRRADNKALIKEQKRRNKYNRKKDPWEPSL